MKLTQKQDHVYKDYGEVNSLHGADTSEEIYT